jgi:group I intron endonuclease
MLELYKLTAPNGLLYIGASSNARRRWVEHNARAKAGSNINIHKAILEFGWKNFKKEILAVGPTEYIYDLEIKAIQAYNTMYPFGYNMTYGGRTSPMIIKSIARRVSVSKTGTKQPSRSQSFKKDGNPMFGKKHSVESIEKMKAAVKNRKKLECTKCKNLFSVHTHKRHTLVCEVAL